MSTNRNGQAGRGSVTGRLSHPESVLPDGGETNSIWRRTLRFSVGVTSAAILAYNIQWPLYALTPALTAVFLAQPTPKPGLKQAFALVIYLLVAFVLALIYTKLLLPFPLAFAVALAIVLFHTYHQVNRGGSAFLGRMSLIAVLVLPMAIAGGSSSLANQMAVYFVLSAGLAVLIFLLAHALLPDISASSHGTGNQSPADNHDPAAAINALKSTLVVWPIGLLFIAMAWSDELLVMIFVALFSFSPQATQGRAAGVYSLMATLAGGAAAVLFYYLLAAVPELHFFVVLMFVTALIGGSLLYSGKPFARLVPSAIVAFLMIIGGSLGQGADLSTTLFMRIVLIAIAVLYVTVALSVLDRWFSEQAQPARSANGT